MITRKPRLKGVSYHRPSKSWASRISKDGVDFHLGYYPSEWEAAIAYDAAVAILHEGEPTNEDRGLFEDMPEISEEQYLEIQGTALLRVRDKIRLLKMTGQF